jgi:C-terminal processing protease CtpA/Prc
MYINWVPEQHQALLAARRAGADPDDTDYNRRLSRARNHGLTQTRVLPGNVRYLRIESFLWDGEASKRAYDDAMRFLAQGEAAVIDIRGNGGGSPEAINYLVSHFVDPNTLLMRFVFAGREERSVSQGKLPAGSLKGKPLYVLIDGGVGSASEEFAMHVAKFHLGELIGQKTAGAGNRNDLFPVAPGFVLSLSTGAALHGTDGKGWEAVGIAPTEPVDPTLALDRAQLDALTKLAAKATGDEARTYAWAMQALKVKLEPLALGPEGLRPYPGQFGERTIRLGERGLVYQRTGGPAVPLTPMGGDLFQFGAEDNGVRVRFERIGGDVGRMTVLYENGQALTYERTS